MALWQTCHVGGDEEMSEFLQRYKVVLRTLTPVFIGSGERISKKEYIYFSKTKEVLIPNMNSLFSDVLQRGLEKEFEKYMLHESQPLLVWMRSVGYTEKEIRSLCGLSMDCSDALDNLNRPVAIQRFMKDSLGRPYIPGSSLKGALRTCLLANKILTEKENYKNVAAEIRGNNPWKDGRKKYFLSTEKNTVEKIAFQTLTKKDDYFNALNDELRVLRIVDSNPIPIEQLILCQKVDKGLEKGKNALNILRECLRPGTEVEFDMVIDSKELSLSKGQIENAIAKVYSFYSEVYVNKFTKMPNRNDCIYLGGGCGYGTKTVLNELLDDSDRVKYVSDMMHSKFPKHGHRNDVRKGVSPHMLKCTRYNGKLYEMGKCSIRIEEA